MLKDIAPKPLAGTIRKARKLRRKMTLPEVLLWRIFQTRPYGLKFRRQHGSDDFVLDFYCGAARLGIEIDGIAHDMGDRPERDARRDSYFAEAGIMTLRIPAADVLRAFNASATNILDRRIGKSRGSVADRLRALAQGEIEIGGGAQRLPFVPLP